MTAPPIPPVRAGLLGNALQCLREGRLPWRLRWLKYVRVTRPVTSWRIISADLTGDPRLPSLVLHAFGPRFLEETLTACHRLGMRPFLAFGTLLGHHRDRGFIRHDADIDLGLLGPDFDKVDLLRAEMQRQGYLVRLSSDHEISFYKPHFPTLLVDFFLFFRRGDGVVYYDRRGETEYEFRFPPRVFDEFDRVKFLGSIDALIPRKKSTSRVGKCGL